MTRALNAEGAKEKREGHDGYCGGRVVEGVGGRVEMGVVAV